MKNNYLFLAVAAILALAAATLILELVSAEPYYEYEWGTIRGVVEDPKWGCVGEDFRTLIKYDNGISGFVCGDLGEEGERVRVYRRTEQKISLFGWFADYSRF